MGHPTGWNAVQGDSQMKLFPLNICAWFKRKPIPHELVKAIHALKLKSDLLKAIIKEQQQKDQNK